MKDEKDQGITLEDNKQTAIRDVEDDLSKVVAEENQGKKMQAAAFMQQNQEKFELVQSQLEKKFTQQELGMNQKMTGIIDGLKAFSYEFDQYKENRNDSQSLLQQEISNEIAQFQDIVVIEKRIKEETHDKLFSMIEDVHGRL